MVLIALAIVTTFQLQWFMVTGSSMAESLRGQHRELVCADCGFRCLIGSDEPFMVGQRGICSNCGFAELPLDDAPDVDGDRVLVNRSAFWRRAPRRFEVVACRSPERAGRVLIKRVVGLPGETISLRHGDLYCNGKIVRKSLAELRASAILVHDAKFAARKTEHLPPRWQGEPGSTRWQTAYGTFVYPEHTAAASDSTADPDVAPVDWLTYHHWRRSPGSPDQTTEHALQDDYGYNQSRPVLNSQQVRDVLLDCRLTTSGRGEVCFFITDGQTQFVARIDPNAAQLELVQDGQVVVEKALSRRRIRGEFHVAIAMADEQLVFEFNDKVLLRHEFQPADVPLRPTSRPLAIGSTGVGVVLRDMVVRRDLYYAPAEGAGARPASWKLAADEYLVLGDNCPVSNDSRTWPGGHALHANLLVGKPFMVHWPSRCVTWGTYRIQVPRLDEIRYIH